VPGARVVAPVLRRVALDSRIEDEDLDGLAEAVEVRKALERLQALSIGVSEDLDAYQKRYVR
jgi:hypothetical protein